jgi:hypothetical protein
MANLLKFVKKDAHHYVLAALLIVFIVSDIRVPSFIGELVDNIVGKIVVVMIALSLFNTHPIVGAIGLVAAYQLIMRSQGYDAIAKYIPSERKKTQALNALNQFPVTIEEEVISKQIPYVFKTQTGANPYKGVQDKLYGAAKISSSN